MVNRQLYRTVTGPEVCRTKYNWVY